MTGVARRGVAIAAAAALGIIGCINALLVSSRALVYSPLALAGANSGLYQAADRAAAAFPFRFEQRFLTALAADDAELHPSLETLAQLHRRRTALPPGTDRDAFTAREYLLNGDDTSALQFALRAGDYAVAEKALDILEQHGRRTEAASGVQALISAAQTRATARESYAAGLWRAARLENYAADHARNGGDHITHRERALRYLQRQLALTPLSGQALLTAGYAALDLGRADAAQRYFRTALASDPASASALVGMARVALAQHDIAAARAAYERARASAPAQADVVRLGRDL